MYLFERSVQLLLVDMHETRSPPLLGRNGYMGQASDTEKKKKRMMGLKDQERGDLIGYDFMINIRSQTLLWCGPTNMHALSPRTTWLVFLGTETFFGESLGNKINALIQVPSKVRPLMISISTLSFSMRWLYKKWRRFNGYGSVPLSWRDKKDCYKPNPIAARFSVMLPWNFQKSDNDAQP